MTNKPQIPMFRFPMKSESTLSYAAAKAAWQDSMVRLGLLTHLNTFEEKKCHLKSFGNYIHEK